MPTYPASPNRKVFLEVFAADVADVEATVTGLTMGPLWDLEIYPIVQPAQILGE